MAAACRVHGSRLPSLPCFARPEYLRLPSREPGNAAFAVCHACARLQAPCLVSHCLCACRRVQGRYSADDCDVRHSGYLAPQIAAPGNGVDTWWIALELPGLFRDYSALLSWRTA